MKNFEIEKIKEWGFAVEDWQAPDPRVGLSNGYIVMIDEYNVLFEIDYDEALAGIYENDKEYFLRISKEMTE